MKSVILGLVAASCVCAGALAAPDQQVSNAAIASHIAGKQFWLPGGVASFAKNGAYNFGGLFNGKWRVTSRSICIRFETGAQSCNKVVRNGKDLVLIDAGNGARTVLK